MIDTPDRIRDFDLTLFDHIFTQTSKEDRRALLGVHRAVMMSTGDSHTWKSGPIWAVASNLISSIQRAQTSIPLTHARIHNRTIEQKATLLITQRTRLCECWKISEPSTSGR
jgi:hypothetical protein